MYSTRCFSIKEESISVTSILFCTLYTTIASKLKSVNSRSSLIYVYSIRPCRLIASIIFNLNANMIHTIITLRYISSGYIELFCSIIPRFSILSYQFLTINLYRHMSDTHIVFQTNFVTYIIIVPLIYLRGRSIYTNCRSFSINYYIIAIPVK